MKNFLLIAFMVLVIITMHASECRTSENCPSCGTQEKWRRRHGNRGKRRNKHGHHKRLGTTKAPFKMLSATALSFTHNNSNFSRQFAKFLQNERSGSTTWSKNPAVLRRNETTEYTEANVEIMLGLEMEKIPADNRTEEKINLLLPAYKTVGKFGYHSPSEAIYGKVVHLADKGIPNSHFGCAGEIANSKEIPPNRKPWIALIARGECTFLVKIKLAESYNASAVVVYDNDPSGSVEVMRTLGAKAVSLMININAGTKVAHVIDSGMKMYMNITVGDVRKRSRTTGTEFPHGIPNEGYLNNISKNCFLTMVIVTITFFGN